MIISKVIREEFKITYLYYLSGTASLPMVKEFYYHSSWYPDPTEISEPDIMIKDFMAGYITRRELIQELVMLLTLYNEMLSLQYLSSSQYNMKIDEFNNLLYPLNIKIKL